jgi:pyruvate kinase
MDARTKIVCTIGPSVNTDEAIDALMTAGMSVARLNCSHGDHDMLKGMIKRLKQARRRAGKPLAICLDTRGPKIRVGKLAIPEIKLTTGHQLKILKRSIEGTEEAISITPEDVLNCVNEGSRILFDDGYIISRVISRDEDGVVVRIQNDGILRPGKGVNIPNEKLPLPAMTDKDREDIIFACEQDIDIIAASYIRRADDIMSIKKLLEEQGHPEILVLAKIENAEGVQNFDTIIQAADGVMIARGDLGVEVPISQVPRLQKMMIRKSYLAGKPSVTATQMMESMIFNPRPTRAEVSDIANAIYDGTSAVMLSGETAVGKYPIEVVNVMHSVVLEAETDFQHRQFLSYHSDLVYHDVPSAVTLATVKTAYSSRAKAIFAFTKSGSTARLLSRLRPSLPILAMTPIEKSYHQMAINWGVTPVWNETAHDFNFAFQTISRLALDMGIVSYGDLVLVTSGSPFGVSGTTNTMVVENIGDVLVRGQKGRGNRVHGNVALLMSPESREPFSVRNRILVIPKCDPTYQPFIANALAVVLHNHVDDTKSEAFLLDLAARQGKAAIVRADGATAILKEGQLVTVDPDKALVYKGVVLQ